MGRLTLTRLSAILVVGVVLAVFCEVFGGVAAASEAVRIIYVDANAPGTDDGTSWVDAYNYLQDALTDANDGAKPVEIRVGQGVYKPDLGIGIAPGDRTATFQLINNVAIRGGYAGFGEQDPDARDIDSYETVLSGDLNGDDDPSDPNFFSENSYHVTTAEEVNETSTIEGLTVRDGNADGSLADGYGGGMYNNASTGAVINCEFRHNRAGSGGGMVILGSRPHTKHIVNCTFESNLTSYEGGGIVIDNSSIILTNCTFESNRASYGGGILMKENSVMALEHCTLSENSAVFGGGICVAKHANMTLEHCILSENSAYEGGGIYVGENASIILAQCTFAYNQTGEGGALHCAIGSGPVVTTYVWLVNCILWEEETAIWTSGSHISVDYSNLHGQIWDPFHLVDLDLSSISVDPHFVNAQGGDYHLKSQAGRWDSNEGRWTRDGITSPCIDAGPQVSDLSGEPWPHGGRINMGAYGGTSEASMSLACVGDVADLNNDGSLDFGDAGLLSDMWLSQGPVAGDMDLNGSVDFADFCIFAGHWPDGGCSEQTITAYDGDYSVDVGGSDAIEVNVFDLALGCLTEVRLTFSMDGIDYGATFDNESSGAAGNFSVSASVRFQRVVTEAAFEDSRTILRVIGADDELFPIGVPDFEGTDTVVLTDTLAADSAIEILDTNKFIRAGTVVRFRLSYEVEANSNLPTVHSRIDDLGPATGHLRIEYVYCER